MKREIKSFKKVYEVILDERIRILTEKEVFAICSRLEEPGSNGDLFVKGCAVDALRDQGNIPIKSETSETELGMLTANESGILGGWIYNFINSDTLWNIGFAPDQISYLENKELNE